LAKGSEQLVFSDWEHFDEEGQSQVWHLPKTFHTTVLFGSNKNGLSTPFNDFLLNK